MTLEELKDLDHPAAWLSTERVSVLIAEVRRLQAELETNELAQTAYEASIDQARAEEREACAVYLQSVGQPGYAATIRSRSKVP